MVALMASVLVDDLAAGKGLEVNGYQFNDSKPQAILEPKFEVAFARFNGLFTATGATVATDWVTPGRPCQG